MRAQLQRLRTYVVGEVRGAAARPAGVLRPALGAQVHKESLAGLRLQQALVICRKGDPLSVQESARLLD